MWLCAPENKQRLYDKNVLKQNYFNFECLVGWYTYELGSTYNVDCDSKRLPHSGMVVYHISSCATIVELVICWTLSSAYT